MLDDGILPSVDEILHKSGHLLHLQIDLVGLLLLCELLPVIGEFVVDLLLELSKWNQYLEEGLLYQFVWDFLRKLALFPDHVIELRECCVLVALLVAPLLLVSANQVLYPDTRLHLRPLLIDLYHFLHLICLLPSFLVFGTVFIVLEQKLGRLVMIFDQHGEVLAERDHVELIEVAVVGIKGFYESLVAHLKLRNGPLLLEAFTDDHALLDGQVGLLHEALNLFLRHFLQTLLVHFAHQRQVPVKVLLVFLRLLNLIVLQY